MTQTDLIDPDRIVLNSLTVPTLSLIIDHDLQLVAPLMLFKKINVLMLSNTNAFWLFQKDDVFKAVPTSLSPPPAPATPITSATPATPSSSASPGTPSTPNSISPSGIVKRKTGQYDPLLL